MMIGNLCCPAKCLNDIQKLKISFENVYYHLQKTIYIITPLHHLGGEAASVHDQQQFRK